MDRLGDLGDKVEMPAPSVESFESLYDAAAVDSPNIHADDVGVQASDVAELPRIEGPFEDPRGWVEAINAPGLDHPGRDNNCVLCAEAVESTWRGDPAIAAPLEDVDGDGLPRDEAEDRFGGGFAETTMDALTKKLIDAGPGTSAVMFLHYGFEGGHAINAVNHRGDVLFVDAQRELVSESPEELDLGSFSSMTAVVRDAEGKRR